MNRRLLIQLACSSLLASLLSGCGFALRSSVTISPALSQIKVAGGDIEMVDELEDALRTNGVVVTSEESDSVTLLDLVVSQYQRKVRTTNANGLATAYDLIYKVEYNITSGDGEELQVAQKLRQTRVLSYSPLQQLQFDEEEEFLQGEMRKEIVLQVLRRLSRIQENSTQQP